MAHIGWYFFTVRYAHVVQMCLELGKRCLDGQGGKSRFLLLRIGLQQRRDILKVK